MRWIILFLLLTVAAPAVAARPKRKAPPKPAATEPIPLRKRSELPASGAGSVHGTCPATRCAAGQECVLIEVHCVAAPCPPVPECVLKD